MKTHWVDLHAVNAAVAKEVPRARQYGNFDKKSEPYTEHRVDGFAVNVFTNGEVLGAWPCRTKTARKLLRTVLDELDRQQGEQS